MLEDEVLAAEETLRLAMLASDVVTLDRLVADRLVFTTQTGTVVGKAADLDAHRTGRLRLAALAPSERQVLSAGPGAAVVNVRMAVTGTFEGTPFEGDFRYTRVWAGGHGDWCLVAGHVSAVLP